MKLSIVAQGRDLVWMAASSDPFLLLPLQREPLRVGWRGRAAVRDLDTAGRAALAARDSAEQLAAVLLKSGRWLAAPQLPLVQYAALVAETPDISAASFMAQH